MSDSSFQFFAPLSFFEKSDADKGKTHRIAGIISTEELDKQGEVIIQKGLDFKPFLKGGWFNDNHSKKTADVLGYPESVKQFQKGQALPDGNAAPANCTWAEGYLLDTPEARRIWDLGLGLQKSGGNRRLGYSIEGQVVQRDGPQNRVVAKAIVRNVAITNQPVGENTRLEVLAKSLEKAMTMGTATPGIAPTGPATGEGAGQIAAKQSLESDKKKPKSTKDEEEDMDKGACLSKSEAVGHIQHRLGCSAEFAERAYAVILERNGQ